MSEQVSITVEAVNDAPVLDTIPEISLDEDNLTEIQINAFDVEGDDILYSSFGGMNIQSEFIGNILHITPDANWFGTEVLTIAASDGEAFNSVDITIVVNPVDDAPVIVSSPMESANILQTYTYQVEVEDADPDDVLFSYLLGSAPDGMEISESGLITWTPQIGELSSGGITITVLDSVGLSDTQVFTITVIQQDCAGVHNGSAIMDDCGECVGGTTGMEFNWAMDCEGTWFG